MSRLPSFQQPAQIKDVIVDANKNLIVSYSDGSVKNNGSVVGPRGRSGIDGKDGITPECGCSGEEFSTTAYLAQRHTTDLRWRGPFILQSVVTTPTTLLIEGEPAIPFGPSGVRINGQSGNPPFVLAKTKTYTFQSTANMGFYFVDNTGNTYTDGITGQYPLNNGSFSLTVSGQSPPILYYHAQGYTGETRLMNFVDFTVYFKNDLVIDPSNNTAYYANQTTFGAYPNQTGSGFISLAPPAFTNGSTF